MKHKNMYYHSPPLFAELVLSLSCFIGPATNRRMTANTKLEPPSLAVPGSTLALDRIVSIADGSTDRAQGFA